MVNWSDFQRAEQRSFGDVAAEYAALGERAGLVNRNHRGLLEVTGKDRQAWLHNLTTHHVKSLSPGDGNYAFVLNVKGRILFDLHIFAEKDALLLDIERSLLPAALAHFNKFIIMEDVQVRDRSSDFFQMGLSGAKAAALLAALGLETAGQLTLSARRPMRSDTCQLSVSRTDFCGPFGVELSIPAEKAEAVYSQLTDPKRPEHAIPVGKVAVEVRRIEAGIPAAGREITDEVLPAETGQLGRAVSFNKGCYLGQEVVERMRARHVVARQLVGVVFGGEAAAPGVLFGGVVAAPGVVELMGEDGKAVGNVTSICHSLALNRPIGLAYVRTAASAPGTMLHVIENGARIEATVSSLPFLGAKVADVHHAS